MRPRSHGAFLVSKPVSRFVNHRILSAALLPLALVLCHPRAAIAQTRGVFAVGVTVTYTQPGVDELDSSVTVGPTFRTLPRKGWGPAFAFNWYGADLTDRSVGTNDKLGQFIARPLLFGVGYTVVRGRTSISPSLVAGPSFNQISIEEAQRSQFSVDGSSFERRVGKVSLAVRPGISATYTLRSRLGFTAGVNYIINRSTFTLNTPSGQVETSWRSDAFSVNGGVVFSLF
jgi:hypothetical protein